MYKKLNKHSCVCLQIRKEWCKQMLEVVAENMFKSVIEEMINGARFDTRKLQEILIEIIE